MPQKSFDSPHRRRFIHPSSAGMRPTHGRTPVTQSESFSHLLVLDFEATCEQDGPIQPCQEIIEFPVAALSTTSWQVEANFHSYVRPVVRPQLTEFCTRLTGIIQETVDQAPTLPDVLHNFDVWLEETGLKEQPFLFVTCGDWDLQLQLPREAQFKQLVIPSHFSRWCNVKKAFSAHRGWFARGLRDLLRELKVEHDGRVHSGKDDVRAITGIVQALAREGCDFRATGSLETPEKSQRVFRAVFPKTLPQYEARE